MKNSCVAFSLDHRPLRPGRSFLEKTSWIVQVSSQAFYGFRTLDSTCVTVELFSVMPAE